MEDTHKKIPSLFEWIGGAEAIHKLIYHFYDNVIKDELLEPIFKGMDRKHQAHVADFIAEVFGGGNQYTSKGGSHYGMIKKHIGKHLTEAHRKRFVRLLLESADEVGIPDDPEFRSAFVGYLEWGTRLATINSNLKEVPIDENEPMPKWGWGETGGPYIP